MKNTLSLVGSVILGVSLWVGSAEAKSRTNPAVEADIPFSFQIGSRTFPAGNYRFELATGVPDSQDSISVLVVRNREAHIYQALAVPVNPGAGLENESRLVFGSGERRQLVAVWHQGSRLDLQPKLLTASEDEGDEDWNGEQLVRVVFTSTGQ